MLKFQRGLSSSSSSTITNNRNNVDRSFESRLNSPLSWKTLNKIRAKQCRRTERRTPSGTVKFFDQDFPCYNWLIPGWLAEERRMPIRKGYTDTIMTQQGICIAPNMKSCLPGSTVALFPLTTISKDDGKGLILKVVRNWLSKGCDCESLIYDESLVVVS